MIRCPEDKSMIRGQRSVCLLKLRRSRINFLYPRNIRLYLCVCTIFVGAISKLRLST